MKISTLENKFKNNHFFLQILTDIPKKSVIFATQIKNDVCYCSGCTKFHNFAFRHTTPWNEISECSCCLCGLGLSGEDSKVVEHLVQQRGWVSRFLLSWEKCIFAN